MRQGADSPLDDQRREEKVYPRGPGRLQEGFGFDFD